MFKDDEARNRAWIVFVFLSGVILFLIGMALLAPSQIVVADDPETTEAPEAEETEDTPDAPTSDPTEPITTTETVTVTITPTHTATITPTHTATITPTHTATITPTLTATSKPAPTKTDTPADTPTSMPSPEPPTDTPAPVEASPTLEPTSTSESEGFFDDPKNFMLGGVLAATAAVAVILLLVLRARRAPNRQPPAPSAPEEQVPGVVEQVQPPQVPGEGLPPLGVTPRQAHPYLQSTTNPQLQLLLEHHTVRIGRAADNDLVIDQRYQGSETLSNHHARFEWDDQRQRWLIIDENSRNGVFVNGKRTGENVLRGGELVRLGSVEFRFHVPELGG